MNVPVAEDQLSEPGESVSGSVASGGVFQQVLPVNVVVGCPE
jgi:hypothetical protein